MNKHRLVISFCVVIISMFIASQFASIGSASTSLQPQPATTLAQTSNFPWSVQEVLTDGGFLTICMVLDSSNNPHIVHSGKNGMMYYTIWDGAEWKTQPISQGGNPYALVLDSANNPHILYQGSNGVRYYASLSAFGWSYQVAPAGNRYSLTLDSQGKPHLAYGTQLLVSQYPPGVTNNYYALDYASWNGTGWDTQVVAQQISASDTISLALDARGNPRIMYGNDTYYPQSGGYTITVKLATWTGSSWNITTGPSELDYIGHMVLDSKDFPHFTYERNYPHESGGDVTVGYASWNGATWSTQTVAPHNFAPGLYIQSDLALDSHDNPRVEFFNGSLIYASSTGSNWNLETVAPDQFAYGEGPQTLDTHGSPNICYWVDDIQNTTAFVSMLIITTPTSMYKQGPLPRPTSSPSPAPPASASQLWVHPSNWSIVSSPILANGLLYVSSGNSGSGTLGIFCLNESTGEEVWSHSGLFSSFTMSDGYVYVGEDSYGPAYSLIGVVSCLNASTGAQLWNFTQGTGFSTPVFSQGIVYASGFSYSLSTDINGGFVYALNGSTGQVLWSFQGPTNTRFDYKPLSLEGENLYAMSTAYSALDASWHSNIYAFDARSGKQLWNYPALGMFNAIVAEGQKVYVSSNFEDTRNNLDAAKSGGYVYAGGVLVLNASNGALLWSYPINSSVSAPLVVNGTVYAVSDDGVLDAFNVADGRIIWSYTAGTGLGTVQSIEGYLYVGSSTGVLCLDSSDGTVIWGFAATDFTGSSPTLPVYSDGIIYVGANGPMFFAPVTKYNFYAVDASTGELLWNYSMPFGIAATPKVENGIVYVGGDFVTGRSPDFEVSGVTVALKPSITSLPLRSPAPKPSPSPSPSPMPYTSPSPTPTPSSTSTTESPSTSPTQQPTMTPTSAQSSSPKIPNDQGVLNAPLISIGIVAVVVVAVVAAMAYFKRRPPH